PRLRHGNEETATMDHIHWITNAVFLADWIIRIGLSSHVLLRRLPVGVSLAWLMVILILPFVGAVLYLTLGEHHLGRLRVQRAAAYREARQTEKGQSQPAAFDLETLGTESAALAHLAQSALGAPVLSGNRLHLLENAAAAFPALIADINQARSSCH